MHPGGTAEPEPARMGPLEPIRHEQKSNVLKSFLPTHREAKGAARAFRNLDLLTSRLVDKAPAKSASSRFRNRVQAHGTEILGMRLNALQELNYANIRNTGKCSV